MLPVPLYDHCVLGSLEESGMCTMQPRCGVVAAVGWWAVVTQQTWASGLDLVYSNVHCTVLGLLVQAWTDLT